MARLARFVVAAELPVILAIAPALLFPTPRRLVVLVVVPVLWLCARIDSGRCIPRTPMNTSLWFILATVGVSLYATFDIHLSLGKVSGVVLGVLLFWAIARWLDTPARLRMGCAAFLLAGAVLAVLGLLGVKATGKVLSLSMITQRLAIRGVPGAEEGFNPNAVSGCLVLFVPLQVALLATGARRCVFRVVRMRCSDRLLIIIQVILLSLTAGTVLLMRSRGAWVGLIVAMMAFLVSQSRFMRGLSVVGAGTAIVLATMLGPTKLISEVISWSGPNTVVDVSVRAELWARALRGIGDFPFTGMGMNAFRKVLPVRYPTFQTPSGIEVPHAHNHLLQAALDLGLPGLVAYISIWIVAATLLVLVYRRSGDPVYRAMAVGLGAGLVAHFSFGITDAIALGAKVGVLFWLTLALVVGLHRIALGRSDYPRRTG